MSKIELRTHPRPSAPQAIELFASVGWGKAEDYDPIAWDRSMAKNGYVLGAYDGERLVGLLRALSDDINDTCITDIVVHPSYQGRGIGTQLVLETLETYAHTAIYVSALASAEGFLVQCGLKKRPQLVAFSLPPRQLAKAS